MSKTEHRLIFDPTFGFRRLDPIPGADHLSQFYESKYYDSLRNAGNEIQIRLLGNDSQADRERAWLKATRYSDIAHILNSLSAGREVLDIGCGTGDLVAYLNEIGFDAEGTEPSSQAADSARLSGRKVHNMTFEVFLENVDTNQTKFDVIVALNVLEHIPDPLRLLTLAKTALNENGILVVQVPNEFNALQQAANELVQRKNWWIAIPDHINYFDSASIARLLNFCGFDIVYKQSDFPMEMFILMGENYVDQPDLGRVCHNKRIDFELSIAGDVRRNFYSALSQIGLGRNCLVFSRLRHQVNA